ATPRTLRYTGAAYDVHPLATAHVREHLHAAGVLRGRREPPGLPDPRPHRLGGAQRAAPVAESITMARIKVAYIGGGSSRAPGTLASIIHQGENFQGSEVVLIDLDPERLAIVKTIADKMARNRGIDLTVTI